MLNSVVVVTKRQVDQLVLNAGLLVLLKHLTGSKFSGKKGESLSSKRAIHFGSVLSSSALVPIHPPKHTPRRHRFVLLTLAGVAGPYYTISLHVHSPHHSPQLPAASPTALTALLLITSAWVHASAAVGGGKRGEQYGTSHVDAFWRLQGSRTGWEAMVASPRHGTYPPRLVQAVCFTTRHRAGHGGQNAGS